MMMPGNHPRPPRTGLCSREQMMRSLIRVCGDTGRGTCREDHLQLMERVSGVHRPTAFNSSRHVTPAGGLSTGRSRPQLSTRSKSVLGAGPRKMSGRLAPLSNRSRLTTPFFDPSELGPQPAATVPALANERRTPLGIRKGNQKANLLPDRSPAFYDRMRTVDPRFIARVHKNMQEKVYCRFKSARDAFRAFDEDSSGEIDFGEFKRCLQKLELVKPGEDDAQVEALFHLCDEDDSGQINYQEFCKWIKVPDRHDNLMVYREDPYHGEKGGMSYIHRANWIRRFGVMCE